MAFDLFTQFATDETAELQGTWRAIGNDIELLIARSGNRNYARLLNMLIESNRQTLDLRNDVADAKSDEIMVEVLAETVLLGWRGPVMFKGKDLPYSKANAKEVLKMREFRLMVARLSDDMAAYRAKLEVEQGNG